MIWHWVQRPASLAYVGGIELWRSGPNQAELVPMPDHGTDIDVPQIPTCLYLLAICVATDGGIYKSTNGGDVDINRDLAVTQFYGMDHSAQCGRVERKTTVPYLFPPAVTS